MRNCKNFNFYIKCTDSLPDISLSSVSNNMNLIYPFLV